MREKLKDKAGQWALFQQIAFDNVLHNPFLYLPVFYVFKASIQKEDAPALAPDAAAAVAGACTEGGEGAARTAAAAAAGGGGGGGDGVLEVTKRGLQKWKDNFWEDNIAMWALCIPSDVIGTSPPAYSERVLVLGPAGPSTTHSRSRVLAFSRSRCANCSPVLRSDARALSALLSQFSAPQCGCGCRFSTECRSFGCAISVLRAGSRRSGRLWRRTRTMGAMGVLRQRNRQFMHLVSLCTEVAT
jgi:hypothetical protein